MSKKVKKKRKMKLSKLIEELSKIRGEGYGNYKVYIRDGLRSKPVEIIEISVGLVNENDKSVVLTSGD